MSISTCSFGLSPLHESAYELKVSFAKTDGTGLSTKSIVFISNTSTPHVEEVLDIHSEDGRLQADASILTTLFRSRDVDAVKNALKIPKIAAGDKPTIMVLDIKDATGAYRDMESIVACERAVHSFLQAGDADASASKHAKKVHAFFHGGITLDFSLDEASLKGDIVHLFSEAEAEFLHSNSMAFCQLTEFFMNAAKLGDLVSVGGHYFSGDRYFTPISTRFEHFVPALTSTTFYPPRYQHLYAMDAPYAASLAPVFSISGGFDEATHITNMSVSHLGGKV